MGFGAVFITVAFVLIIGLSTYMLVTGTNITLTTISDSLHTLAEKQNERVKTEIELGTVSVTNNSDHSIINLSINNTGATKVLKSEFVHIDLFVYFHSPAAGTDYKWLPYTTPGDLNDNEWTVVNITPDIINPGIFDPGEQMNTGIRVYPAISEGTVNWLKVVLPNAVSDSKYFNS